MLLSIRTILKYLFIGVPFLLISILLFVLVGCKNEYESWKYSAYEYAKSDLNLSKEEYENLIDQVEASKDEFPNLFNQDGAINHEKIRKVLIKKISIEKLDITEDEIYNPLVMNSSIDNKFNINVYLENSASMDGYVNGKTEFETAIYSLLGDIRINDFCDSLNLNYINKSVHKFEPDIEDFIDKLEPSTFRIRGGDRSTSDLSDLLESILGEVNKNNASILISDFVFSPGKKKGLNARDYLNNQMLGIKINFAQTLKTQNISVVALQLYSNFNGTYYDLQETQHNYKGKRPYYIWLIGQEDQVKTILKTKILDNIKGGVANKLVLTQMDAPTKIKFKIARNHKKGNFDLNQGSAGPIRSAEYGSGINEGVFGFTFYADFSNEIQNSNFYLDESNYQYNPNYSIEISLVLDLNDPSKQGYTHKFSVETKDLKTEVFKLEIVGKTPDWVSESSSEDDRSISVGNDESKKTFGLKYLIDGVVEACYPNNEDNVINKLEIPISR